MLTFAHPWVVWLAPLPLVVCWLVPASARISPAVRVPFLRRLLQANGGPFSEARAEQSSLLLLGAIWLLVLASLARPQWLEPPIERPVPTRDLLLLVDLSGSMSHEDFTNAAGKQVDRLTALKEVLGDFLVEREGDRVGLVVFGTAPFLQVPFSTDLDLSRKLLDETEVGMAGPRTSLGDAMGLGIRLFEESDAPAKTMIALTDGVDNASQVPPTEAARVAADREIVVYTIAMGDPTTVGEEKIDEEELRAVARLTGGQFFSAMDRTELSGIYQRLDEIETREVKTVSHRPRRDLYYWPLVAALLLSLLNKLSKLFAGRSRELSSASSVRLRVNARTFELETVEQ